MVRFLESVAQLVTYEAMNEEEVENERRKKNGISDGEENEKNETPKMEYIRGTIKEGSLGIKFTHELEIELIQRDTQACKFIGLSRGDRLLELGGIKITGDNPFQQVSHLLKTIERPCEIIFERHCTWNRNVTTGLPEVDWMKVKEIFSKHADGGGSAPANVELSVDPTGLTNFISEVHNLSMVFTGRQSLQTIDMEAEIMSTRMIHAHDDNDDGRLQWSELTKWLEKGLQMTRPERQAYAARGNHCPASVRFLEGKKKFF